jgi:hypothetical protein
MTVTKTDHRSIVVLKLPTRIQGLITYASGIVKALTGNPSFPTVRQRPRVGAAVEPPTELAQRLKLDSSIATRSEEDIDGKAPRDATQPVRPASVCELRLQAPHATHLDGPTGIPPPARTARTSTPRTSTAPIRPT